MLSQDRKFIVIEHFNQDAAEECFDCQRKAVCRNDNPLLHQFEYNDNTIRLQESIAPVTGNSRGADKSKRRVMVYGRSYTITKTNDNLCQTGNKVCVALFEVRYTILQKSTPSYIIN